MHVRVWFAQDPDTYYSGSGRTLAACVRRAKAACRALLLSRKRRPLRVLKTEEIGKAVTPTTPRRPGEVCPCCGEAVLEPENAEDGKATVAG